MLRHLSIRNFVIVDRLDLEFSTGFGALTGETGAGKSILIDALALTLGERADAGVIRSGCDKAEVAASFEIADLPEVVAWLAAHDLDHEGDLMLRRVVDVSGRSRAYINGSAATVQQLREVSEWLVDIHGQHAHQSLLRADAQRQLLDSHAGISQQVRELGIAFRAWREAEQQLLAASEGADALLREREQLEWQINELAVLEFNPQAWQELEAEHSRLGHAASLIEGAQFALGILAEDEGACERQVDRVAARLDALGEFDPALQEVANLVQSVQAELSEAVSTLRRYSERLEVDPARLSEIDQRIESVLSLARKYRVQPEALSDLLSDWQQRLEKLVASSDLAGLETRCAALSAAYQSQAVAVSAARQAAALQMGQAVSEVMRQLALSSGVFEIALLPIESGAAYGLEQAEFRIRGLAGNESKPLAKVASGGELSRISLAIQVLTSRSASVPTLIFDEVDVGIGGGVAEIVGRLLNELGSERQVLCVTHLPQVAAQADWQWQVSKTTSDGVVLSSIQPLDESARVAEIARMLGGVEITDITLQHAHELLRSTAPKH